MKLTFLHTLVFTKSINILQKRNILCHISQILLFLPLCSICLMSEEEIRSDQPWGMYSPISETVVERPL